LDLISLETDATDGDKRAAIMDMIENVLTEVVQSRILFRDRVRGPLAASWEEVRPNVNRLRNRLRDNAEGLKEAGLEGANLDFKYQGLFDSYWRLNRGGGIRRLKRFFGWAKIVVGSITTMVPGLKEFAEILSEYMEAINMGIEDAEGAD
jgi:hypothetical protein